MQHLTNETIMRVNNYMHEVNVSNDMMTPDIAATICEKPPRIHYSRLRDGVHPTDHTLYKIANKTMNAINHNRRYPPPHAHYTFQDNQVKISKGGRVENLP